MNSALLSSVTNPLSFNENPVSSCRDYDLSQNGQNSQWQFPVSSELKMFM